VNKISAMNESILFLVVAVLLFSTQIAFRQVKKPMVFYVRILAALTLLLFVWIINKNSNLAPKILLSAIALTSLYKEYISAKKFYKSNE
jgi:hypothetical protein